MRYDKINIRSEIKAGGSAAQPSEVLSFNEQNLPSFTTVSGGGGGGSEFAIVEKAADELESALTLGEAFSEENTIIRVTNNSNYGKINPLLKELIFINYDEKDLYNRDGVWAKMSTADWQGIGDYSDVIELGTLRGPWSYEDESSYTSGDIVIWGSTSTGIFEHYKVLVLPLTGETPGINTTGYEKLSREIGTNYGYVDEWCRVKFDRKTEVFLSHCEDSRGNVVTYSRGATFVADAIRPSAATLGITDVKNSIANFPWGRNTVTNNLIEDSVVQLFNTKIESFANNTLHFSSIYSIDSDQSSRPMVIEKNELFYSVIGPLTSSESPVPGEALKTIISGNSLHNSSLICETGNIISATELTNNTFHSFDYKADFGLIDATTGGLSGYIISRNEFIQSGASNMKISAFQNGDSLNYPFTQFLFTDNLLHNMRLGGTAYNCGGIRRNKIMGIGAPNFSFNLNANLPTQITDNLIYDPIAQNSSMEINQVRGDASFSHNNIYSSAIRIIGGASFSGNTIETGSLITIYGLDGFNGNTIHSTSTIDIQPASFDGFSVERVTSLPLTDTTGINFSSIDCKIYEGPPNFSQKILQQATNDHPRIQIFEGSVLGNNEVNV
jgi:hypothetical protein